MIKEIISKIESFDKIVLFHHVNPDGDSISCSYGLLKSLKVKYPNKKIKWIANKEYISQRFWYLKIDFDDVIDGEKINENWLAIQGDTSVKEMVYGFEFFEKCNQKIVFDHHKNKTNLNPNIFWHEPTYNASAMQAYEIVEHLNIKLNSRLAILLLFGILTDTGNFLFSLAKTKPIIIASKLLDFIDDKDLNYIYNSMKQNTKKFLHFKGWILNNIEYNEKIAYVKIKSSDQTKLDITPDKANAVNLIANIEDIDAWAFFVEYPDFIRVEMRSKGIHVNEVATYFGGGGHIRASGCKILKNSSNDHWKISDRIIEKLVLKSKVKTSYEDIWNKIKDHHKITIVTHKNPDGDTLFSAKALKHLINLNFDQKEVRISCDKPPQYLENFFKEDYGLVEEKFFNQSLKIVVDTSSINRFFDQRVITIETIKIDHHHNENNWKLAIGGDFWPATSEIIYEMIKSLNLKTNEIIKEAIYISILTDTCNLLQRNISWQTKTIISWTNKKIDDYQKIFTLPSNLLTKFQNFVNEKKQINDFVTILSYEKIEPFSYYRIIVDNLSQKFINKPLIFCFKTKNGAKCSIRTYHHDAHKIAKYFNGSGHFYASGFTLKSTNDYDKIIRYIKK